MALKHAKSGEVVDLRLLGDKLNGAKTSAIIKLSTSRRSG
jgi:hypothetical protein